MKVSEFVEKLGGNTTKLADEIKKEEHYMPYLDKVVLAERITRATMINPETQMLQLNTPAKYILSTMELIYRLTSLEPSDESNVSNIYSDYDLLCKNDMVETILKWADIENEYEEFNTVLVMVGNDLIQNKYESHVFTTEIVSMVTSALTKMLEPLTPALDKLANLSEEDKEKISKKVNKTIDRITK